MKAARFLLIVFIFIMCVPHPDAALAADVVQIIGYVYDVEGNPVKGVFVGANSLSSPWVEYRYTITDAGGHYNLSFDRPKRLDVPVPSHKGRPIFEGCRMIVALDSEEWVPITFHFINTQNKDVIEQDFILKPAGAVKLKAYNPNDALIERFPPPDISIENATTPAYTTDLHWRLTPSQFVWKLGMFVLSLNTPHVLNFPWNVPGFGRVILRADNGGKGFTLTRRGEMITINLNCELARTECRLLRESYERYLDEGYVFSENLSLKIQSACELLRKADSMTDDVQKAHFADSSLNRTLWAAESLELGKALQDIEKYRKGNATLRLVDENGRPMEGVDVAVSQITHDFFFGAALDGFLDLRAYELLREAGINYGLLGFYWYNTECPLGQYIHLNQYPLTDVELLKNMGFRMGTQALILLEPGPMAWDTGLVNLSFEQLRTKIYEHVYKLVSTYSDYIDYWTIVGDPHVEINSLGFTREQVVDLVKTGVGAVRSGDPTSQILVIIGDPCGYNTAYYYDGNDDKYTVDPYTFFSRLGEYGIDHDGIAVYVEYGSLYEFPSGFSISGAEQIPLPFRDLASVSRILDWYHTLSEPIHVQVHVPGNFKSNLGYWHRRSWDEELQAEWIEKFYTIAFSKPLMREITYWSARDSDYMKANRGLLDVHYIPRESFYALRRLITENWTTRLHTKTDANGQLEFRGFAGDYNITVSAKDFTPNFTVHVYEGASNAYTINLGRAKAEGVDRAKAERAIAQAGEAVSRAKAEGRTIYLDRAENLLEDAGKALIEENFTQAMLLAEEANRAADLAVTWLVIPAIIAFVGGVLCGSVILYRHVRAKRRKPSVRYQNR